jgi:hypothetical protein
VDATPRPDSVPAVPPSPAQRSSVDLQGTQYDLKIDEQTEKFIETKQKLSYFLITASVAVTAFLVTFVFDKHPEEIGSEVWLVVCACLIGLATAGASLLALHWELRSYGMHIAARYQKLEWKDLSEKSRAEWDRVNGNAASARKWALVLLFVEIALSVVFFVAFVAAGATGAG